jgi:hypothetical protein
VRYCLRGVAAAEIHGCSTPAGWSLRGGVRGTCPAPHAPDGYAPSRRPKARSSEFPGVLRPSRWQSLGSLECDPGGGPSPVLLAQ